MHLDLQPGPTLDDTQPIGVQLLQLLRGRIIRVEIEPGSRVSEAGLAAELSISRQPVREAFIKLAEEGLLEIRPQRGTVVPKISIRMVGDARFVREAIEAEVVRRAATLFGPDRIALLEAQLADQVRARTVQHFIELDDLFHRTLAEGIGRDHAWRVVEAQKAQLDRVRYLSLQRFPKAALIEQHRAIVDGIRQGNPAKAETAMRRHLDTISDDLPVIASEHPEFFRD